jgi:hypothetical protein
MSSQLFIIILRTIIIVFDESSLITSNRNDNYADDFTSYVMLAITSTWIARLENLRQQV